MHAKVTVADDVVFAGSFNLSRSGEMNAENVLELHDPELAERLAAFIDEIRGRYEPMPIPDGAPGGGPPSCIVAQHLAGIVGDREQVHVLGRDLPLAQHPLADPVHQPAPVVASHQDHREVARSCRSGSA